MNHAPLRARQEIIDQRHLSGRTMEVTGDFCNPDRVRFRSRCARQGCGLFLTSAKTLLTWRTESEDMSGAVSMFPLLSSPTLTRTSRVARAGATFAIFCYLL